MLRSIRRLRAFSLPRRTCYQKMGQYMSSSVRNDSSADARLYDWKLNQDAYKDVDRQHIGGQDDDNSIRLVTFNVLAPCYKRLANRDETTGRKLREAYAVESWSPRAKETLSFFQQEFFGLNGHSDTSEVRHESASIIALQEFWQDADYLALFASEFSNLGYTMAHKTRSGGKTDAVALLVKDSMFEVLDTHESQLITGGDRVAILMFLRHKGTGEYFLIANTHLSFPHTAFDRMLQVQQITSLTQTIESLENKYTSNIKDKSTLTTIVTGDFNAEPRSQVCKHMKTSGYVSCFDVTPPQSACNEVYDLHGDNNQQEGTVTANRMRLFSGESDLASPTTSSQNDTHFTYPSDNGNSNKSGENGTGEEEHEKLDLDPDLEGEGEGEVNTWVSHFTHLQEELGVDHIFIKRSAIIHDSPTNEGQETHTANNKDDHAVFVHTCSVLPLSLPARRWNNAFTISDHRPVSASLLMVPEAMKKK